MSNGELAVIVHGGAGSPETIEPQELRTPGLAAAVDAAWQLLCRRAPAEEAVVAALKVLEADPYFDAGYGSFPNAEGRVFVDAGLMRGDGKFSSVMHVPRVKYPSQLVLKMLSEGKHFMRAWDERLTRELDELSAEERASLGVVADEREMLAPYAVERVSKLKKSGTVGCVVRDAAGVICAGTSTGGTPLKPHGRVGDSPIIGLGTYANNAICGLSATGWGEAIMGGLLTGFVVSALRREPTAQLKALLAQEIESMHAFNKGEAGLIVVPRVGDPAYAFNSRIMSVGMRVGTAERVRCEEATVAMNEAYMPG